MAKMNATSITRFAVDTNRFAAAAGATNIAKTKIAPTPFIITTTVSETRVSDCDRRK